MSGYVLSPRAKADPDDIWDYTERNWGTEQAKAYIRLIGAAIQTLAISPALGKACDHIQEGYRKYPAGSHVVFFRLTDRGINVVRILHRRMDFDRHLG
ncbi:MAG: type II toxin-antitoxin system RelE/ParE family toxin [Rhodomicrobium sp.]